MVRLFQHLDITFHNNGALWLTTPIAENNDGDVADRGLGSALAPQRALRFVEQKNRRRPEAAGRSASFSRCSAHRILRAKDGKLALAAAGAATLLQLLDHRLIIYALHGALENCGRYTSQRGSQSGHSGAIAAADALHFNACHLTHCVSSSIRVSYEPS